MTGVLTFAAAAADDEFVEDDEVTDNCCCCYAFVEFAAGTVLKIVVEIGAFCFVVVVVVVAGGGAADETCGAMMTWRAMPDADRNVLAADLNWICWQRD